MLTGGGSGGHTVAASAIGSALMTEGWRPDELLWVGGGKGPERSAAAEIGIGFCEVPAGRAVASAPFEQLRRYRQGVRKAAGILADFAPDVVLGTGGYASIPALVSARKHGIPCAIHEQTIIPGWANRYAAFWAQVVMLTYPDTSRYFRRATCSHVGLPLRPRLSARESPGDARRALGLDPNLSTIYVTGGSQGASFLNDFVKEHLTDLLMNWQVIHQCGAVDNLNVEGIASLRASLESSPAQIRGRYLVMERMPTAEVAHALHAATLVVSRAGAGIVNELIALGVPAILVPYPHSRRREQELLAAMLAEVGAAVVVPQSAGLAELANALVTVAENLGSMSERYDSLRVEDPASALVRSLEELVAVP